MLAAIFHLNLQRSRRKGVARKTRTWTAPACASRRWITAGNIPTRCQAIKPIDAESRSCIYVPIMQSGRLVDSQGYVFGPDDE
jgi:type IV pilus biogenesis protein CpaD/CtpE